MLFSILTVVIHIISLLTAAVYILCMLLTYKLSTALIRLIVVYLAVIVLFDVAAQLVLALLLDTTLYFKEMTKEQIGLWLIKKLLLTGVMLLIIAPAYESLDYMRSRIKPKKNNKLDIGL